MVVWADYGSDSRRFFSPGSGSCSCWAHARFAPW